MQEARSSSSRSRAAGSGGDEADAAEVVAVVGFIGGGSRRWSARSGEWVRKGCVFWRAIVSVTLTCIP